MNVFRIVQLVLLVVLVVYLVLLHNANLAYLDLPFLLSAPPAVVIALALVLGWLAGWLPGRIALWRRRRDVRRLERRVEELEQHIPSYAGGRTDTPIIPDRPSQRGAGTDRKRRR